MTNIKPFILVFVGILIGTILGVLLASVTIKSIFLFFAVCISIIILAYGISYFIKKLKKNNTNIIIGILVVIFIIGIIIGYSFIIDLNDTIRNSKELTMNMMYYSNWITLV